MDINYIGEDIFSGILGKAGIIIAFLAAALSAMAFYQATEKNRKDKNRLQRIGSISFYVHFFAVLLSVIMLLQLILRHRFEYQYVWQYSSTDLALKYIISCFWAGQGGSFLTWTFLQSIIGLVLLKTSKSWKPWVMSLAALSQVFLSSALLGIKMGAIKLGTSPFELLRNTVSDISNTIFTQPNYLESITDGNGLNPLLENIWMTTHPPVLFLGYAAVMVPAVYAIAGLWRGMWQEWLKPALPWMIFSTLILGAGILLGGMWAYVSLTFGGFWAWDPVENASLVPWMILIAGLHFSIISKKQNNALMLAFLFTTLAYFFVLYASFLTRSGVLGQTSVHSFGDDGMVTQLVIYMLVFLLLPLILLIRRHKKLNINIKDSLLSREFFIFLGGIIMVLAAFQIIFVTSVPVWNTLFGLNISPPNDPVAYYNRWQLPYALLMVLLIGLAYFLRYGQNDTKKFLTKTIYILLASFGLTLATSAIIPLRETSFVLFLIALYMALIGSIMFIIKNKGNKTSFAAGLAHIGFAIFLIGVVLTFSNAYTISKNTSSYDLGNTKSNQENIVLMKNDTLSMSGYLISYTQREQKGSETFYTIEFMKENEGKIEHDFTVRPSVNRNDRFGDVYNPATKHQLTRDIYTFLTYAEMNPGSYKPMKTWEMNPGDSIKFGPNIIRIDSVNAPKTTDSIDINNLNITAYFSLRFPDGETFYTQSTYSIHNGREEIQGGDIDELGIRLAFEGISGEANAMKAGLYEKTQDYIVMKATINPYINIMWLGTLIMAFGLILAWRKRYQNNKSHETI